MRRAAAAILGALMMVSGILAAPATKPASLTARAAARPASQPTTAPARADPTFVADFNEHLLNAKFDDVVAKLRQLGALAGEPQKLSEGGQGKLYRATYRVPLNYAWEYGSYTFTVDQAGKVYQLAFGPGHFPATEYDGKLKAGNKWWLVKFMGHTRADATQLVLSRVQARTADEAAKEAVSKYQQTRKRAAKAAGQESADWMWKVEDIEAHEWFEPQLKARQAERVD